MSHPHRAPCPPPPAPRSPAPELLDILVERLVDAHLSSDTPGSALIRVRPTDDGVDLALRPLPEGQHPVDALVGTTVGGEWSAVGVVADGVAHPLEGDATPRSRPAGDRVVMAVLVDRGDQVAHRVVGRDTAVPPTPPDAPEGRVVDVLRRSLGLPTPPPATAAGPWWATLWLDRIVAEVAADPGRYPSLVALAELHPLVGPVLDARDATVLHRIPSRRSLTGWEAMRRAVAAAGVPLRSPEQAVRRALLPLVSPEQAHWFDEGSFARWLEGTLPARPVLLAALDALLSPHLARALRQAVGE